MYHKNPPINSVTDQSPSLFLVSLVFGLIIFTLFSINLSGSVLAGYLLGPDDYMRMSQVHRFMDSGQWFNVTEPRISPPNGLEFHWTRLPDLPIALVITILEPIVGREFASNLAAIIIPAILLIVMLHSVGWMSRPILGHTNAPTAVVFCALALPLVTQFLPGRVDHHPMQLIVLAISIGLLFRMVADPNKLRYSFVAGIVFAVGMWIGVEIIPWLACYCLALWFMGLLDAAVFWRANAVFGTALFAGNFVLLPISQTPDNLFRLQCDTHSIAFVGIAATVMVFGIVLYVFAKNITSKTKQILLSLLVGGILLVFLLTSMPQCLQSPYGNLHPMLSKLWIANIMEVRSIDRLGIVAIYYAMTPLFALLISFFQIASKHQKMKSIWLVNTLFLLIGILLSAWQQRFFAFAHVFAIIPISFLAIYIWEWAERFTSSWKRIVIILTTIALLGPLPSIALVVSLNTKTTLPQHEGQNKHCDIKSMANTLNKLPGDLVLANFITSGSELVYRTRHSVIAAGYHRNSIANSFIFNLFSSENDATAHEMVSNSDIDLITFCSSSAELQFYLGRGYSTFAERLANKNIPIWLEQIPLPSNSHNLLFKVRSSK